MIVERITGPTTNPTIPRSFIPPIVPINIINGWTLDLAPIIFGLMNV